MNDNLSPRVIPQQKPLDDFQVKFLNLPEYAQNWMCSLEAAENTGKITEKFNLKEEANPVIARITGDAMLKDISLEAIPVFLQRSLGINQEKANRIALEIALKQLLVLKDYLRNIENFIIKLGGAIPKNIAELAESKMPPIPPANNLIKKPFREAVHGNKEVLNQMLTANPIKITDFEQPVRPTIKNWLSDYVKQKGAGHHDELERSDYLFANENAKNLSDNDRSVLSIILKAYDDDIEVPVSLETNLILINELASPEPNQTESRPAASPKPAVAAPVASPYAPPAPRMEPDAYREPVAKEDLAGPFKQPPKPAPKLDGNVINLRDLGQKNNTQQDL